MTLQDSDGAVFISYSHKDRKYLDRLQTHLKPYEREGLIDRWDDTRLKSGANWRKEISDAIGRAKVAILLVTADFLASDFIAADELPPLLEAAEKRGVRILPVIVKPSIFKNSPLSQFQAVNDPSRPLAALPTHKRDDIWARLVEDVADALRETVGISASNNSAKKANLPIPIDDTEKIENAKKMQKASELAMGEAAEQEHISWFHDVRDFFDERLARTFPGTSGLRIFNGQEAFARLVRLLEPPLTLSYHNDNAPLWWWRGGMDMYIDRFEILDDQERHCLIWHDELLIDTVAVYRSPTRNYRSFIYVTTRPDQPTGVYPPDSSKIEEDMDLFGYSSEETGYWNGHYISRAEYDDGYAEIDGQIVRTKGAEVRRRYLTPYNFFIASQSSVLNNVKLDSTMKGLCQDLLKGTAQLEDVVRVIENAQLSDRQQYYYELYR